MLNWLLWTSVWFSDLFGIYCIVLQGKFHPSVTSGKFKQMLRRIVFATIICCCSAATQNVLLFSLPHTKKKRKKEKKSGTRSDLLSRKYILPFERLIFTPLLEYHTPSHIQQQWQMYSGIIIHTNCSYLCFKDTSSNTFIDSTLPTLHPLPPTPTQPPAVVVPAVFSLSTSLFFLFSCCCCSFHCCC